MCVPSLHVSVFLYLKYTWTGRISDRADDATRYKRVGITSYSVISKVTLVAKRYNQWIHYCDVIMGAEVSQITSLTIVYKTVYSDQRKHQSSASLAFVRGIHRGPGTGELQMTSNAETVSI